LAINQLDLTEGDNAKIDLTPSDLSSSSFEQTGPDLFE
jgi:hypothetical protein